jgi:hypothetical protein
MFIATAAPGISTSPPSTLPRYSAQALRAALRVSQQVQHNFALDGGVVLRRSSIPPAPLKVLGRPSSAAEERGIAEEASVAAALACSLLGCDCVRDPVGSWGAGWTTAYDFFSMAHLMEHPERRVTVVLPRYPMALTLHAASASPLGEYPRAFGSAEPDGLALEPEPLQTKPALELDAGDVLVLRGDKAQSPVTGLSGGDIVYSFVACERDDADALYASPMEDAREQLVRSHLRRSLGLAAAGDGEAAAAIDAPRAAVPPAASGRAAPRWRRAPGAGVVRWLASGFEGRLSRW